MCSILENLLNVAVLTKTPNPHGNDLILVAFEPFLGSLPVKSDLIKIQSALMHIA